MDDEFLAILKADMTREERRAALDDLRARRTWTRFPAGSTREEMKAILFGKPPEN